MFFKTAELGIGVFRKILDLWSSGKADSLIDYTQVARVEPIVLIDTDCLYSDSLHDLQQSLLSVFAGYYLQAIAISATIGKINVIRHLDKLNPNRSITDSATNGAAAMGYLLAEESYKDKLPVFKTALEHDYNDSNSDVIERHAHDNASSRDTVKELKELSNLSVGKMFNVEITDGGNTATIPVSIRLMASSLPSNSIAHILSIGSKDNSAKERYHSWKAGRLEFIKDLVFCQDLIDAHRKELMTDKDGVYTNLINRARSNQTSSIVSANPSVATASNIVIISDTTAEKVEMEVSGKLHDFKTREKIFKESYIMILCVMDKKWERVTMYSRGINGKTELSAKDLKSASKGSGTEVTDLLKAFSLGNSPTL